MQADIDLRVGGRYRISFNAEGDVYTRSAASIARSFRTQRLVFSWAWHSDAGAGIAGDDFDEAGRRRHAAHAPSTNSSPMRPPATVTSADGRNCSAKLESYLPEATCLNRSRPCSRTPSSPARNGSPPARLTSRMRRNTRTRASAWPRSAARCRGSRSTRTMRSTARRKGVAGRPVQGAQPARGAALHVRARLERWLQELLVLGRRLRAHDPASRRARHHDGCDLARAAAKARRVQAADGLDVRLAVVRRKRRSTTITAFRSRRSKSSEAASLQFRNHPVRQRGSARNQRVLSR